MSRSFLRPLAVVAAFAGLAAYATIMLRGPQGLSVLEQKRHQIRVLEVQNADLARDIQAKKQRIERLKDDPATQELEIRKRLHMQREGETEFILPRREVSGNPVVAAPQAK
ncbi:MAG: FtsB family cell division protein [Bryobacteraceae bacterium]